MNIYSFWTVRDYPLSSPDCLIVLSYAVENRKKLTEPTKTAVYLAYKWWKKYPSCLIILSTGDNQKLGIPNSLVMAQYARTLGIPEKNIIQESESKDTYENIIYSMKIVQSIHLSKPMFVLYDLHTRRAVAIAKKQGIDDVRWVSSTGPGSPAYGWKYIQTYSRGTILIYETLAWFYNAILRQL